MVGISSQDLRARTLYQAVVAGDYAIRTGLASAVTVAMTPSALFLDSKAERKRLEYYATLASAQDPAKVFSPPPEPIPVHSRPGSGLEDIGGHVELLRFRSPFEPLHPDLARAFRASTDNAVARAQYWRHDDGPRATVIVIHGFGASSAAFNTSFFSLREFFAEGWDIVLFTLPFHGGRQSSRSPFNGAELFSAGFSHLSEAMTQAVCDLRVMIDYLQRKGAPRIGATGLSLGGYTTALLAEVDNRLDFAIPNAAVSHMPTLIKEWFPANLGLHVLSAMKSLPEELISRAAMLHSPLNYPVLLPKDRLLVIGGAGDRVSPPSQTTALWRHWDEPELHWFPGSHIIHLDRARYQQLMRSVMGRPEHVATQASAPRATRPVAAQQQQPQPLRPQAPRPRRLRSI
jgi:pimeloyl-ACP methyl ester carboxylesterase